MKSFLAVAIAGSLALPFLSHLHAEDAGAEKPPLTLLDLSAAGSEKLLVPSSPQVSVERSKDASAPGAVISVATGKDGYPGVSIEPEGALRDLSGYGHVEAKVTNTGTKNISLNLRLDNKGNWQDNPWNAESTTVKPGATGTVKVVFGHSYGYKKAYPLNPSEIVKILIFTGKSDVEQSYRIESLVAAGPAGEKPPVDPKSIRILPKEGALLGNGLSIDATKQVEAKSGSTAVIEGEGLKLTFAAGKTGQYVVYKPVQGRWDLRQALQVKAKVKNLGTTPVTPTLSVGSNGGSTDKGIAPAPIAPGAEGEVAVSFIPAIPWQAIKGLTQTSWTGEPNTGTKFTSDAVSSVNLGVESADGEKVLLVTSIIADVPPAPEMPEWLGKRPPVEEGEWVQTFNEDFDGTTLDPKKWRIYTENYWDKRSHFSKDNLLLKDGILTLRYEKKTGFHNDDPNLKKTDYATGFIDTYGKWVQRYGYFEARMKLPTAPGLWPAFWLMPDRGYPLGPQWKRADTANEGMEFDIMEFLSRWGPYRYNIALHWDGYGKEHKQTGSTTIYFAPDKDGYITAGVLWLPGKAVFYANGKEVFVWESPRISSIPSDIMFTHVSGGWDNNSIDDATLPDDFLIDYVRVWQRKDLASDVDGYQPEPPPATPSPTPAK